MTEAVPTAKQAFITRKEGEPQKKGSLGVEHASKEALERALSDLREVQAQKADFDYGDYVDLSLAMGRQSRQLREQSGSSWGSAMPIPSVFTSACRLLASVWLNSSRQ